MLEDLIRQVVAQKKSLRAGSTGILFPPSPVTRGIPTLKVGAYHKSSPMLTVRYSLFGRWEQATHGHWLSIADMETVWEDHTEEDLLERVKINRAACEGNWANDAAALFRPERLSLFAGDNNGNERIYLLWLDFEDEPEVWAYDSNGESRYRDLRSYLEAYLSDDLSASARSWR
ncbi:MAG: hypothetical protein ACRYFY_06355, partial [Janthinobacterium lividum]